MQWVDRDLQQFKQRCNTPDTVDTANKDERPSGIPKKEVVKVQILQVMDQLNHEMAMYQETYLIGVQAFNDAFSKGCY